MSGYISPGNNTSISANGGLNYDSGKIELASGPGITWTRTAGNPTLFTPTGSVADAGMPPGLFIAGTLAVANPVASLANLAASGQSLLTLVEANLGTAPVGASAGNCMAVQVSGKGVGSGTFTLPLDGTGSNSGAHYGADLRVGSQAGSQSFINSQINAIGGLCFFQVTAQTVVGGIAFDTSSAVDASGHPKMYEILSSDLNTVLATSAPYYGPVGANTNAPGTAGFAYGVPFTQAVTLNTATTYAIGWRATDVIFSVTSFALGAESGAGKTYTGNVQNSRPLGTDGYNFIGSRATVAGQTWRQVVNSGAIFTDNTGDRTLAFALLGGAREALIIGTVNIALVAQGTVPANPGANLNLRFAWQQD